MMLLTILVLILLVGSARATTEFIFNGFAGANLSLNGLAAITPGGLLMLTNDTIEELGHALYPSPVQFKAPSDGKSLSFSTTFVVAIVPQYADVSGHGLAFFLSSSKELRGSMPSQHLGLFNTTTDYGSSTNHIIAVELDTVKTVEFQDIDNNHVGIDLNSLVSKNSSTAGYFDSQSGSFTSMKLISGDAMQVWVEYGGKDSLLDVTISPAGTAKPVQPLVSSRVDLSSIMTDDMYIGFSASTGAGEGSHYVLGWSFSLNKTAQYLDLSKLPSLPSSPKKIPLVLAVALPLAAVILLLILAALTMFICRRRKQFQELYEDWEKEYGPHRLSYRDLHKATKGFSEENLIGAGGFGKVFRGTMPKLGTVVAVKKISHDSKQGMREFVSEIACMSRLRHRNVVQLLGYCRRQGELLLVYDYMAHGSLDKILFKDDERVLSWSRRFHIIKGVAAGLLYLHEGWEQVVVHRDIKASNVLLDGDLNGKLGDFGLARLYDHGSNLQTTHIVGTLGYLAPELSKTGKATTSTDVFAFGAFLLEVACGRRPMEPHAQAEMKMLVDLVLESWKMGTILEMADPKMSWDYAEGEVEMVLKLGLLCSHPDPEARPSMRQVVQILDGDTRLPITSPEALKSSSKASSMYNESFNDLLTSCSTTTEITCVKHSLLNLSGNG